MLTSLNKIIVFAQKQNMLRHNGKQQQHPDHVLSSCGHYKFFIGSLKAKSKNFVKRHHTATSS